MNDKSLLPLRVYGPGGPYRPVCECARVFERRTGARVEVVKGEPDKLAERMAADGDLHYTGAPSMMEDFLRAHPGVIDEGGVVDLQVRRVGILVRKGNPKGLAGAADLGRPGLRILDVRLENMYDLRGDALGAKYNVIQSVPTGEQGLAVWKADPTLDAWVTYRSWHVAEPDASDFVPLEGARSFRATPAALTRACANRETARAFVEFMRSEEGREIFRRHGWE